MKVKTSGVLFKEFLDDNIIFHDGVWIEKEELTVNGVVVEDWYPEDIKASDVVTVKDGIILREYVRDDKGLNLASTLKRWLKAKDLTTIVVQVKKTDLELMESTIKSVGGKILNGGSHV